MTPDFDLVLVGDVGGTNTRLQLYKIATADALTPGAKAPGALLYEKQYLNGDFSSFDAVVAACEAGGDWTRGASLFTMWAANGVQGANDELRRAIAASSGLDPGPARRGTSVYNAFRREPPAESQGVAAPRDAKTTTLTAKVQPFVPRGRPSVLRDDAKSSESKSPPDEGENPPDEAL